MLDALAFLPVADVAAGMEYLSRHVPQPDCDGLQDLVVYFDATYVNGTASGVRGNDVINRRQQNQQASSHKHPVDQSSSNTTIVSACQVE